MSNQRYMMRGVSASKEDVHNAIKNVDKGIFPGAFCKIIPDILGGDPEYCNIMHADGAGTKTSAVLTDMNQVLGRTAGNAVEVAEAVAYLKGQNADSRQCSHCRRNASRSDAFDSSGTVSRGSVLSPERYPDKSAAVAGTPGGYTGVI